MNNTSKTRVLGFQNYKVAGYGTCSYPGSPIPARPLNRCSRLAGWVAGWLGGWVAGSLAGWLADWLARQQNFKLKLFCYNVISS